MRGAMMEIHEIGKLIHEYDVERRRLMDAKLDVETRLAEVDDQLEKIGALASIVQSVLQHTQTVVVQSITDLVNRAFDVVFSGAYRFEIQFEIRRGRVSADVWFIRDGVKIHPADAVGGGVVDVASLVLRMAFWSLKKSTIPVIVFDEPLKFLSVEYRELAGDILRAFAHDLGVQIIMVSHIEEFFPFADRMIGVYLINGRSAINIY